MRCDVVTKTLRKIVKIDEEKCNGCGACITSCAEGALKIIDGKAKLISEKYCDGLGNCLECPQGAISIEEREAEDFNEAAVEEHLQAKEVAEKLPCDCPSAGVRQFERPAGAAAPAVATTAPSGKTRLGDWRGGRTALPPPAPFLKGAGLVLAADRGPFAYAGL